MSSGSSMCSMKSTFVTSIAIRPGFVAFTETRTRGIPPEDRFHRISTPVAARYPTARMRAIGCTAASSEDLLARRTFARFHRARLVVDLRAVARYLFRPLRDEVPAHRAHA